MPDLPVPLAVEKVLFRLALMDGGRVTIARAFVELPLSIEDLERAADAAVDGRALLKDEWGEFLSYDLPELKTGTSTIPAPPDDCPTCGGGRPEAPEGELRPLVCDRCYGQIRRAARQRDEGALARVTALWKQGEDPATQARLEHELFHVALKLGGTVTHTALAAQSRVAAAAIKECLDRFAMRKYIHLGVAPTGDAMLYRFPPNAAYPDRAYARFQDDGVLFRGGLDRPAGSLDVKAKPAQDRPPDLKIVVKDRRQRPGPRPFGS